MTLIQQYWRGEINEESLIRLLKERNKRYLENERIQNVGTILHRRIRG